MHISDIRATTVTVPLDAPLRHGNGCHWGRFVRTIVEVETDNGPDRSGRDGRRAASRRKRRFVALKSYLVGHDPARLEEMRFRIANPTASLYNNRTQLLAALEFACLDVVGQAWGVPVYQILRRKAARPRAVRHVLFLALCESARRAKAKSGRRSNW